MNPPMPDPVIDEIREIRVAVHCSDVLLGSVQREA